MERARVEWGNGPGTPGGPFSRLLEASHGRKVAQPVDDDRPQGGVGRDALVPQPRVLEHRGRGWARRRILAQHLAHQLCAILGFTRWG